MKIVNIFMFNELIKIKLKLLKVFTSNELFKLFLCLNCLN